MRVLTAQSLWSRLKSGRAVAPPRVTTVDRKETFFTALDGFQRRLSRNLSASYHDERFCKLLAMKVSNLFAGEFHFHHRHSMLASHPVQLLIDPANGCQLRCPGCVHSANPAWSSRFDWPSALLSTTHWEQFLERYGTFGSSAVLYNYGEPLLHRELPFIIRAAKRYLLFTIVSTNLALKFDVDALVSSGLDRLMVSVDGASQPVYDRYRRKGKLSLVVENLKAIVESKYRLGRDKPYVVWQFLTFEHNLDEVDDAIDMARRLGVNEIQIVTPFDVGLDDPAVKPATSEKQGRIVFESWNSNWCSEVERMSVSECKSAIDAAFSESWLDRYIRSGHMEEPSRAGSPTCNWLYHNITMDGARRILPCCIAPRLEKGAGNLVYGRFERPDTEVINTRDAVLSRQALSAPETFKIATKEIDGSMPYCAGCMERPIPVFHFNVADYVYALDNRRAISSGIYEALRRCALYPPTG